MKNVLKTLCLMTLVALIAMPLAAEDEKKKKKKKGNRGGGATAALMKRVKEAGVDEETLKKIEALAKEYGPKIAAANKAVGPEVQKQRSAARKAAAAEGKKGKELAAAIAAAVKLTDEQQAAMKDVNELRAKLNGAIAELLTPEQQKKAKIRAPKKPKKKKKDAA